MSTPEHPKEHPIEPADRRPGPTDGLRARNRRRRLETLHREALALFLARGLQAVTVEELATAAGMAKSNFYRYASDKEALVEAIIAPAQDLIFTAFDDCATSLDEAPSAKAITAAYMRLATRLLAVVEEHRDVVMLFLQEGRGPDTAHRSPVRAFERELLDRAFALTRRAHAGGKLRNINFEVSTYIVLGAVERLLLAYLRDGELRDAGEVVQALVRLVMEGLEAP